MKTPLRSVAISTLCLVKQLEIAKRIFAMTLISVLLAPIILLNPNQRVSAQSRNSSPVQQTAPPSAPPEPFVLTAGESSTTTFIAASLFSLSNVFSTPKAPDGLEIAKVPTFGSRLTSYLGSFFGLFTGSAAKSAATEAPPPAQPPASVDFDFDNDGKTDFGRWHPSTTEMKIKNSNGGSYSTFTVGSTSSRSAPGDFNGDDKTDACVFLNGVWKYKTSTGGSEQTVNWGTTGDIPVAGDYDGDDITDFAVFRPSTNYWYVLKSTNGSYTATSWGTSSTDILVQGDYDGDNKTDHAVYRPSDGNWYILGSTAGYYSIHWGNAVDIPVPADYDGDGKTDPAVFRTTTGDWFAYKSSTNNGAYLTANWGGYGDQPVPGDYDGDSKADFAIWRPTTGAWYVIKSSDSSYMYDTLGIAGDTAVPSSYIKQIGSPAIGYDLNIERLKPTNATGSTNLYSRNFYWDTSLVGLPGRSGLDAGLGLSYNSLVWIKQGSSMVFDPDNSNITPGFRFGFPVIEPVYYNTARSKYAYLMVTPSGGRVEFRQTAVGNTYDTADSSYAQLVTTGASSPNDPAESITIKVTSTSGTQMSYEWKSGAFRCTRVMDRNGNYVTATYNGYGDLETVTDTLGRVVTVNYSAEKTPTSITQTWKGTNGSGSNVTHTWASFTYTTIQIDTNFGSLNIFGPQDGTYVKVLQKVKRADDSYTTFDYNTWGQVKQINNYAPDAHKLNHVAVNLPANASSSDSDCPRFTETKSYAENFNGGSEVTFNNSITTSQSYSLPGSISGTATKIQTWMTGHPDNLRTNTFVGGSGWNEALPIATEDCITTSSTCSSRQRWTWSSWTQDDTGVSYPLNPRMVESRVGDASNVKKSTTEYYLNSGTSIATYGLVKEAKVYDTNLTTELKKIYTEYNLDSAYTSRRIIGLPSKTEVSGHDGTSLTLISKTTYAYDEGSFSDSAIYQNISPTQHDNTNYSSSFVAGRGNLTSTTKWDVNYPTTSGYAITSSSKYNTAGSIVSNTDPRGRVSKIFYADNFNTSVSGTYAYPTTLTDAGGYTSTIKYRFDTGANVWAQSPVPYSATSSNTYGKTTSRTYDDTTGRATKEKIENTGLGAYTRYVYGSDGITLDTYSTIVDANSDSTIDSSDEVLTTKLLDGAGRVRKTRTENPGSSGGYTGQLTEYDVLGHLKRSTVPTEINSSWNPAGDDYRGMDGSNYIWLWNSSEYDWKGRVTRTIPSDSTGSDGKDSLYTYDGCGCAGGQVTTIKGPVTTALDVAGDLQTTKRRTQKSYEDILGRTYKTEIWDLDGGGSAPYSTTKTWFNGRDQATTVRQYSGSDSSGTFQDKTMTYDGHGRLASEHKPEQFNGTSSSPTYTTYTYNSDNSTASKTDPRGAVTTYKYGHVDDSGSSEYRSLLTKVQYSVPGGSGIYDPADVSFTYDAAGNRTQMTDETGSLAYSYDELSRLKTETKDFADTLSSEPSGGYVLAYTYHLTGGLKSITDPLSNEVRYTVDKTGRTTAVGDASSSSAYASSINFRAFGSLKDMSFTTTNPIDVSMTYDSALRPATYEADFYAGDIHNAEYSYHNDGKLSTLENNADAYFDHANKYDFAGRLIENEVGPGTFMQIASYDRFNNLTSGSNYSGITFNLNEFSAAYADNRKTSGSSTDTYDVAGNVTLSSHSTDPTDILVWKFDAAGRQQRWEELGPWGMNTKKGGDATFDGDGRRAKNADLTMTKVGGFWGSWTAVNEYFIYSSVTGQKIADLNQVGALLNTTVYLGEKTIAQRSAGGVVRFKLTDPVTGSEKNTDSAGVVLTGDADRTELGAFGTNIPLTSGQLVPEYAKGGFAGNSEAGCIEGRSESPQMCVSRWREICLNGDCDNGPYRALYSGQPERDRDPTIFWWGWLIPSAAENASTDGDTLRKRATWNGQKTVPYDESKLENALESCAKSMFGVELADGGIWSGKGQDGHMNFRVLPETTVKVYSGRGIFLGVGKNAKTFTVYNDATSYPLASAAMENGGRGGFADYGRTPGIYNIYSSTIGWHFTNRTYTASDRETSPVSDGEFYWGVGLGIDPIIHTQIHEAGNALSHITGKVPEIPTTGINPDTGKEESITGHNDAGLAFEKCVLDDYRKRVGL